MLKSEELFMFLVDRNLFKNIYKLSELCTHKIAFLSFPTWRIHWLNKSVDFKAFFSPFTCNHIGVWPTTIAVEYFHSFDLDICCYAIRLGTNYTSTVGPMALTILLQIIDGTEKMRGLKRSGSNIRIFTLSYLFSKMLIRIWKLWLHVLKSKAYE